MNTLKRSALVPYTARQMFELVNNIEDYPRFLPWCTKSDVSKRTEQEVIAELEITWKGMHKSFSTRNVLHPYNSMEIQLITGPMRHMQGKWQFVAVNDHACKVLLDLEFEFSGSFIDLLFQPVFQSIANSLVDAFCKRAVELYGHANNEG
jgi:ribosome-associated toxin RatA of RatAB toxin-antitoxin module